MNFNKAEFYASYGRYDQLPPSEKSEVVFSGRSNVGKSSLINKILSRKSLARVSGVPGKTATINFYSLENIYLVDLPGYGYAKTAKSDKQRWSGLINGYLSSQRNIALIFQLVDFRHPPTRDDINMINAFIDAEIPFVIILTKADKLKKTEREQRLRALESELPCFDRITLIPFSSATGEGKERVKEIIEEIE